jgi:hypothetical protein
MVWTAHSEPIHRRYGLTRERGCSRPGCTVAGAYCQVHHAVSDWADGGQTNIDDLTLGCPQDNRSVKQAAGPPENAQTDAPNGSHHHRDWGHLPLAGDGQSRVNNYHPTPKTTYYPTKTTSRSARLGATGRDHHRLLNHRRAVDHVWLHTGDELLLHGGLGRLGSLVDKRCHRREVDVLP